MSKCLVADLGGTNIRFGLSVPGQTAVKSIRKYTIRDYESIDHLIKVYLHDTETEKNTISDCCIAIAGPIDNDRVKMTNCDWEISCELVNRALNIGNAALINDFHAIALSAEHLSQDGLTVIGDQAMDFSLGPVTIFGPGTGLGAALLVPDNNNSRRLIVVPTEGGHAGLSARSDDELRIFEYWRNKGCRINREFFVSGAGIERIYEALTSAISRESANQHNSKMTAAEIQQLGCHSDNEHAQQAMNIFCSFLGSAAGDQALCTGSTGGVLLAGGILPKFVGFLQRSPFRKRFESKGAMSGYASKIPTALIVEEQPGLIGAAAYLNERNCGV